MNLTRHHKGFPTWPEVEADYQAKTVSILAKHVTYNRYRLAQSMISAGLLAPWILVAGVMFKSPETGIQLGLILIIPFSLLSVLVMVVPTPLILARLFFPKETSIFFTPDHIWIDKNSYDLRGISIGFRVGGSPMHWQKYNVLAQRQAARLLGRHDAARLNFSAIEMLYGGRRVPITTVRTLEMAQQFAIALQMAFDIALELQHYAPIEQEAESAPQVGTPVVVQSLTREGALE